MKIIKNSSALQERASQLVQKIAPYFFANEWHSISCTKHSKEQISLPSPSSILHGEGAEGGRGYY